jgi:disintegrin and metalloproteinase domain-containing protein 17
VYKHFLVFIVTLVTFSSFHRFYKEMGGSNSKTTVNYLISLIDRVHKIYNDTVWRDTLESGGFSGMGFIIKKIVVHRKPTQTRENEVHYNMFRSSWDVRNLLEVFSREYTHKDFCLAHLFTDIKFEGGILGLAYVGSPRRNSVGGICTPEYFKNGYTLYLNSGLSSSRNHYGQRVITREADLVTAHEFGHNWGSEHDPDIPECSPSASQGGSYLMYTYSVSGYDVNNKKFSPCSLRFIRKVLLAKSSRCFTEPEESFCGNLRVEGEEECDAGLLGSEDKDPCCNENCKLKEGSICSDKNSPCCHNCQYMAVHAKCRAANYATCEKEAACTGVSADCPKSEHMPDETNCIEKGKCRDGKCIPFCETQGEQSCMCDNFPDACKRCCRRNLNSSCNAVSPVDILPDGTPCFQGFCHLGQCEKSNPDHIVRIIDIFKDISLTSILKFLKDNVVGTVIFVSLLFWIPLSCLISWVDRKRADQAAADWEWRRQDELIHPNDKRRIIHLRVPKRNNSTAAGAAGGGNGGGTSGGGMEQQTPEHRDLVHRNVVHQSAM